MYRKYIKIQRLKKQYPLNLEKINYAYVAAVLMYPNGFLGAIKRILYAFFFLPKIQISNKANNNWKIIYSLQHKKRADLDDSVKKLCSMVPPNHTLVTINEKFDFFAFLRFARYLKEANSETRKILSYDINYICLTLLVAKFKMAHTKLLEQGLIDCALGVITFCDAMPYDNLITQMAKNKKIKTITNQHGLYRRLTRKNISADAEAYKNFISDKIFCWGLATVTEFLKAGINQDRLIITGKLSQKKPLHPKKASIYKQFGVLLNGENGKFSNKNLIRLANEIAEKTGFRYYIRPHPANKLSEYTNLTNEFFECFLTSSLDDYLTYVDFSLSHMTGTIIDLLGAGHRIYIMEDAFLAESFKIPNLAFSKTESIVSSIEAESTDFDLRFDTCQSLHAWFDNKISQEEIIAKEISKNAFI